MFSELGSCSWLARYLRVALVPSVGIAVPEAAKNMLVFLSLSISSFVRISLMLTKYPIKSGIDHFPDAM